MSLEEKRDEKEVIFVNKKRIEVTDESLTGSQILLRAGYDANQYDLFSVHGQKDEPIAPNQAVQIENGLHFNAILKNVPYGGRDDT